MTTFQAFILGAVQGIAEFLPVSSSGHLAVLKYLFGLGEVPLLFDVLLHVATLLVIVGVFRRRLAVLSCGLIRGERPAVHTVVKIAVASVPTALVGLSIHLLDLVPAYRIVGVNFLLTALVLLLSRLRRGKKTLEDARWYEILLVGVVQGFAVFPGISRSGVTIATMLLLGFEEEISVEFSFFLAIPAILGALFLTLGQGSELSAQLAAFPVLVGVISAMVIGYASLTLLLRTVRKLHYFACYLLPLAAWILLF